MDHLNQHFIFAKILRAFLGLFFNGRCSPGYSLVKKVFSSFWNRKLAGIFNTKNQNDKNTCYSTDKIVTGSGGQVINLMT